LTIRFVLKNTGKRAGSEIIQIYVKPHQSRLKRPLKELKGFRKIHLNPGESKTVLLTLTGRDFAYFDDRHETWVVESGQYSIAVGASSEDIRLEEILRMDSKQIVYTPLTGESYCYNLVDNPLALEAFKKVMVRNGLLPEDVTDEFIEAIRHNFIPLFKSVTRQAGGKVSRDEFNGWMDEVNSEVLKKLQSK
jgi:beta-glucosidase